MLICAEKVSAPDIIITEDQKPVIVPEPEAETEPAIEPSTTTGGFYDRKAYKFSDSELLEGIMRIKKLKRN